MIPNQKIKLLEAWKENIFDDLSISEIMKNTKKKTKPWVFNTLKLLTKKQFLIQRKKGNINLYSLNLNNPFLIQTLQYLETQSNLDFSQLKLVSELIHTIPLKNYCLLVFGSYAKNKQTKNSDLDLCFLIETNETEKRIKPYFNEVKLNYSLDIDEHYILFSDFIKMLTIKEENLGKQIFKKHKIFLNADIYYELIKEANQNGFRPQ